MDPHLLIVVRRGRGWKNYSFVHKGVHHIIKPIKVNDIKAAIFPSVKKKENVSVSAAGISEFPSDARLNTSTSHIGPLVFEVQESDRKSIPANMPCNTSGHIGSLNKGDILALEQENIQCAENSDFVKKVHTIPDANMVPCANTSKPPSALVQGEGNDMATTIGSKVLYDGSESVCKDLTGSSIKVGSILINWKEKKEGEKEANDHGKRCMKIAAVSPPINEVTQLMSKPRTALFKGGEDDESKVHQINSVVNVEDSEYKAAAMSRKHSFIGVMYRTKCEVNTRKFIQIGSMQVEC